MSDDRLERLERRVAELEGLVRKLVGEAIAAPVARESIPAPTLPSPRPPAASSPVPHPQPPRVVVRPRAEPPVAAAPGPSIDWEQWVGQRGLLVVGILALLATGGFFLNYAIQHGWIPPAARASGAVLVGIALAVWGDWLVRRGMLRYGAAIIGGGGGLVYLGIWAAAGPYALVNRQVGIALLAVTSGVVAALAVRHAIEALAIWSLAGAYFAPLFLAGPEPEPAKFLAYMAVIGTSWLLLAERMSWRAAFDIALFGYFLLPAALIANDLNTTLGVNYGVLGAVVALLATGGAHRAAWPEARLGALVMVWTLLLAVDGDDALRWTALAGGFVITAIVWWQQLRSAPLASIAQDKLTIELVVYLTPLALVTLGAILPPTTLVAWGGAIPLALAVLYLASGWALRAFHMVVMGFVLFALAVSGQWDGAVVAAGWALLAAIASMGGRWGGRPGAAEAGAVLAPVAFLQLFSVALALRSSSDPAFLGSWSTAWYICLPALALTARLWKPRPAPAREDSVSVGLWSIAGATLLAGGSVELVRAFDANPFAASAALLFYWLAFALALVRGAAWWQSRTRAVALGAALMLVAGAYFVLFTFMSSQRAPADAAFYSLWSFAWYACCAAGVGAALWWPRDEALPEGLRSGRAALWWAAGACLLVGGSTALRRAFTSKLAGDLAISTFWLVYAGALVTVGFRLDRKVVRSAGLGVAALAALKIVLYDLSALQALYRVGSFFVLALITLAVAYAYNKRARETRVSGA